MKKIKIAFTGVFDIDNFGDHLFPIIFENSLRKRKIDVELFLFSPYTRIWYSKESILYKRNGKAPQD